MSLGRFKTRIRDLAENVYEGAARKQRRVALALDQTLVLATPVDTGRARSNWQVSVGAPADETREAYSPGKEGSSGTANAAAAISQAQGAVKGHRKGQGLFITNNLPYIVRLNEGHSPQADPGFIEAAAMTALEQTSTIRILGD